VTHGAPARRARAASTSPLSSSAYVIGVVELARELLSSEPAAVDSLLAEVKAQAAEALESLRELARGIYPLVLADLGLAAALEVHVRRLRRPVELLIDQAASGTRLPQELEAAAYFCCLEALQNAAKHAREATVRLRLSIDAGWLCFDVSDNAPGFDASLALLARACRAWPTALRRSEGILTCAARCMQAPS
jgi:signal transduction histidine kinase